MNSDNFDDSDNFACISKMADGCFLIFCGIPGSGKSTLAKELTLMNWEIIGKRVHFIYVSYDDFIPVGRPAIATETSSSHASWKEKRIEILNGLEELVLSTGEVENGMVRGIEKSWGKRKQLVSNSCLCGEGHMTRANDIIHVIVIDDNMYYRSMRYEYYQLARKASFGFAEIYLRCPLDVALSRNENRRETVPKETIAKMANRLEKPDPEKFLWEQFSIMLESNAFETNEKWAKILELLQSASSNVPPPLKTLDEKEKVKDRAITAKNIIHQADQVMRKHISSKLEHVRANMTQREDLKQTAQLLNQRKKRILEKIKSDPQQMSASVFLEQYKFSCEIQENRAIEKAENVSAKPTSKCVQHRDETEDLVDRKLVYDTFCNPSATICCSNSEENRHSCLDDEKNSFICCTAELDSRLSLLDHFWSVVSVDEFSAFIRGLFERCSL